MCYNTRRVPSSAVILYAKLLEESMQLSSISIDLLNWVQYFFIDIVLFFW